MKNAAFFGIDILKKSQEFWQGLGHGGGHCGGQKSWQGERQGLLQGQLVCQFPQGLLQGQWHKSTNEPSL